MNALRILSLIAALAFTVGFVGWVVRQCAVTGTAVFVKQLGARDTGYQRAPVRVRLKSRKGADMAEWPVDLRVRQIPIEKDAT